MYRARDSAGCLLVCICLAAMLQGNFGALQPEPPVWPEVFHAVMFVNRTGNLAMLDLWYDWPQGRNMNIIHKQQGSTLHDLEWTNGTSFYYDLEARTCKPVSFSVGILRPDWLANATYLGEEEIDGQSCHGWTKAEGFIRYWSSVETGRPVRWTFFDGVQQEIMSFEEGAKLEEAGWQAPEYCFEQNPSS